MLWQAPRYQVPPPPPLLGSEPEPDTATAEAPATDTRRPLQVLHLFSGTARVRASYLDRIRAKEFAAVLLSPPCSSFLRATWANFRGPRPVRNYEHPRGLETLTPAERDRAILENIFADFSFEVANLVADGAASFLAMEQPEDLGALASGPHERLRPASMWQWP
eukprot:s6642_g6.t1